MNNFDSNNDYRKDLIAFILCLFACILWVILLSYKYFHFGYDDWDLAYFSQSMWDLSHGISYNSLFDANFFSNHDNLIAYLVLPIYQVFQHPLILIFLKVFSFITAAYVLYIIAKEKLGVNVALIILFSYLIYTPNVIGIGYDFDFESLSPVFLMLIYFFYIKDHWWGFILCAVILILIKENLPLIVLAFSIHALFVKKDKIQWSIIPGALALISFYVLIFVFTPLMSGRPLGAEHGYYIGQNYKSFGGSISGILFSIIFHPIIILKGVFYPLNLRFLSDIFESFFCLPFLSPGTLFLISPIFLQHLLSSALTEHSICYAYVLPIAPFLFLATINSLKFLSEHFKKVYSSCLMFFFLFSVMCFCVNFQGIKIRFMPKELVYQTEKLTQEQWELVNLVPPNVPVVASFSYLAPLSKRTDLYAFIKIYDSKYQNKYWSYQLPSDVKYALIDMGDPWLWEASDSKEDLQRIRKFLKDGHWKVIKRFDRYALFKREVL